MENESKPSEQRIPHVRRGCAQIGLYSRIMPKECAAADCSEVQKKWSGISFHTFPTDKTLLEQWVSRMNRLDRKKKKQLWRPGPYDVLCSKHFEPTAFTMRTQISRCEGIEYRAQLLPDAVPTLFLHSQEARKRASEADSKRTAYSKRRRKEMVKELLHPVTHSSLLPEENEEGLDEDLCSVSTQTEPYFKQSGKDKATQAYRKMVVNVSQQTLPLPVPDQPSSSVCCVTVHSHTQTDVHQLPPISDAGSQTDQIGCIVPDENAALEEDGADGMKNKDEDWQHPPPKEKRRTLIEDLNTMDPFKEPKYLVFESKLEELLSLCRSCCKTYQVTQKGVEGTAVEYSCVCEHCSYNYTWNSQPYSKRLPLGNLVLAAAAFFSACSPSRLITLFKSVNISVFGQTTYTSLQSSYILPAVRNVWTRCQERLFAARPRTRPLKLAGDGRCDSPGHSAKYGAYSFLDAATMEVLHIELVQSNTVKNSHAMELEGLKRGLAWLKTNITVSHLVTDRHTQIKSYMAKNEPNIQHQFDIWHMAKGVGKKLEAASQRAGYEALGLWSKSIKTHMYYCSQSSREGPTRTEEIKAKWISIANHISNQHNGHGDLFPDCLHGDLSDEPRAWIRKDTPVHRCLEGIVKSPYLLRDIGQLSPDVQTAHLEAFHSVINHFAPKMLHFTFPVMQAKLYLAAMHTNANAGRDQSTTEEGELRWKIARPRANKGQPTAKPVKENITRCYLNDLFEEVVTLRLAYSSYEKAVHAQQDYKDTVPETMSASAGPADKHQVVAKQRRRINWRPTAD